MGDAAIFFRSRCDGSRMLRPLRTMSNDVDCYDGCGLLDEVELLAFSAQRGEV